jgi:uncharacterized BrkB/YihY/UPF0761 family membrane protein
MPTLKELLESTRSSPRVTQAHARVAATRQRVPLVDLAFTAVAEDADIGGGILAGALAYRLFLFLLSLAFLLIGGLGLLARVVGSTPRTLAGDVGLLGLVTQEISATAERPAGVWVALTALIVVAYATNVLYRSARIVHALAWEHSAAPAKRSRRSLRLFVFGVAVLVVVSALASTIHAAVVGGVVVEWAVLVAVQALVWLGISITLPHAAARWTDLIPGAVLFGVGLFVVHAFNLYMLEFVHKSRSNTYGSLGTATTILFSLYLVGRLVVSSAVLNSVLYTRRTGKR